MWFLSAINRVRLQSKGWSEIIFHTHFMSCCSRMAKADLYFTSAASIFPFRYSSLPNSRNSWTDFTRSSSFNCQDSFSYSFGSSIEMISAIKQKWIQILVWVLCAVLPIVNSKSHGRANNSSRSLYPSPSFCMVIPQQCLRSSFGFPMSRSVFATNGYCTTS